MMRSHVSLFGLLTGCILLLHAPPLQAQSSTKQPQQTGELTVVVSNLQNMQGSIRIAVFNNEAQWLKESVTSADLSLAEADCEENQCRWTTEPLPYGEYGIAIYHDENSNDELDTGLFGIPTEEYGFSNQQRASFGPPDWQDSYFNLSAKRVEHQVRLD